MRLLYPRRMPLAKGTFDVKVTPLPADDAAAGSAVGRYALDKHYHGDLEGPSRGEMLGAGDPKTGSAGGVAIEHITGTLQGRSGSFALQHFSTMSGGSYDMKIIVVPGSSQGALAGITGTMKIIIENKQHFYEFDYTLPEASS